MSARFLSSLRHTPRARVLILAFAALAGALLWLLERSRSAASLGLFVWLSPCIVAALWLTESTSTQVRKDASVLVRVFLLLVAIQTFAARATGMHVDYLSPVASAAILLSVLAPLLVGCPRAAAALRARLGPGRARHLAAVVFAEALPTLLWGPVFLLAVNTHRPHVSLEPRDVAVDWPSEPVTFAGKSGTPLQGLWFPNPEAKGAVLLIHGLGGEKCGLLYNATALRAEGYHVFTYDQRGHGRSGGLTTTLSVVEADDAVLAWKVLLDRTRGADIPRLVMGISMGGATALRAAPRLEGLEGIVLDSAFFDVTKVAPRLLPLGPVTPVALAVAQAAAVVVTGQPVLSPFPFPLLPHVQLLLLHGMKDPLVPIRQSEILAGFYGDQARFVALQGEGHAAAAFTDYAAYHRAIELFGWGMVQVHRHASPQGPR